MKMFKQKPKIFEDKPRYKIRADPKDHSLVITIMQTLKKGAMVDLYINMSKKFPGEKVDFDDMDTGSFELPERFIGLLHGKLMKAYKWIEEDTRKDFRAKGQGFQVSVLNTKSCTFTKNDNEYEVLVKAEGYWKS